MFLGEKIDIINNQFILLKRCPEIPNDILYYRMNHNHDDFIESIKKTSANHFCFDKIKFQNYRTQVKAKIIKNVYHLIYTSLYGYVVEWKVK